MLEPWKKKYNSHKAVAWKIYYNYYSRNAQFKNNVGTMKIDSLILFVYIYIYVCVYISGN